MKILILLLILLASCESRIRIETNNASEESPKQTTLIKIIQIDRDADIVQIHELCLRDEIYFISVASGFDGFTTSLIKSGKICKNE